MRHWLQLATRNWRAKPLRSAGVVTAIALGVGAVVWVTCCYESVRRIMLQWSEGYVGTSHVTVLSPLGRHNTLPQRLVTRIAGLPNVRAAVPLLVQRLSAVAVPRDAWEASEANAAAWEPSMKDLDLHGIDLAVESEVRDWGAMLSAGRLLRPDDLYACVLEASVAEEEKVGVGDVLLVWGGKLPAAEPTPLEIVGIIERKRIARFLKGVALVRLPVLQEICQRYALITSVDVVLHDARGPQLEESRAVIQAAARTVAPQIIVRSAAARQKRIELAQDQQQAILILLSSVAMLTALFIILSTLSMGLVERIRQMGLLRCIGVTGRQLVGLTLAEVIPLGVIGVLLGVPIGFGLAVLTAWLVPQYVGSFAVSVRGVLLASAAGLGTALAGALVPALAAATVTPLEATRPRARRAGGRMIVLSALLGLVGLGVQLYVLEFHVRRDLYFVKWAVIAVVLLYLVYALVAPGLVWLASRAAVPVTAGLVRVRLRLLQDQVGHAVWRSAGVVCGLMVGLSLIVGLVVFNASFRSGWNFPKQFPEAYVWSFEQMRADAGAIAARIPGVRAVTAANAVNVVVEERAGLLDPVLTSATWFLGIDPDSFLDMVKLEFVEGDEETARARLKEGGYILVAADFARSRRKSVDVVRDAQGNVLKSNEVRVWFSGRFMTFKVAGVIDSPALDIAASYFQVMSESTVVASGSVIGTNADLTRIFGVHGTRLLLLNFDLPPEPVPAGWPPPRGTPEAAGLSSKHYDSRMSRERRWQNFREVSVLNRILAALDTPRTFYGTARELKDEIDAQLTNMTYLLTAVPAVALVVAALGVANLMTANVASRAKQLAIMRAVGATRSLVLRLVMGEALVVGLLGSALGLGLGLHLAWNVTSLTVRMWGYLVPLHVPWMLVGVSVVLTVGLCILAAVVPARHAARTNIIAALHVT